MRLTFVRRGEKVEEVQLPDGSVIREGDYLTRWKYKDGPLGGDILVTGKPRVGEIRVVETDQGNIVDLYLGEGKGSEYVPDFISDPK